MNLSPIAACCFLPLLATDKTWISGCRFLQRGVFQGNLTKFIRLLSKLQSGMVTDRVVSEYYFAVSLILLLGGPLFASDCHTIKPAFSTITVISATPEDMAVPVGWTFTNHWDCPMLVEKFDEPCDCFSRKTLSKDDESVVSGKRGTLHTAFTPGAHRGFLCKSLDERSAEREGSVEYIAEATIPSCFDLLPRDLARQLNETTVMQWFDATTDTPQSFNITGIFESRFQFTTEVVNSEMHYRIGATPTNEVRAGMQSLIFRTDRKNLRDRMITVFLNHPSSNTTECARDSPQANRAAP